MSNPNNFFIQKSSINFQFEFYKNISNFKYDYKRNLSKEEIYFLLDFIKYKPFKVVELDKNVGVGILSNNLYNSLCLEILTNSRNFLRIENDPLESSCDSINNILHNLYLNKYKLNINLYSLHGKKNISSKNLSFFKIFK